MNIINNILHFLSYLFLYYIFELKLFVEGGKFVALEVQ